MKCFLRIVGGLLTTVGLVIIIHLSASNWKDSKLLIWMNHWKTLLPALISFWVGYFMLMFSEKH